jgi:hypothetical protein
LRSALLSLQQAYLRDEGAARRGPKFARLVGGISTVRRKEPPVTEVELLGLLGPPDYGDSDNRGALFIYLYDRNARRDWAVFIEVDADGTVARTGWNAADAVDLSRYAPYPAWPEFP